MFVGRATCSNVVYASRLTIDVPMVKKPYVDTAI